MRFLTKFLYNSIIKIENLFYRGFLTNRVFEKFYSGDLQTVSIVHFNTTETDGEFIF